MAGGVARGDRETRAGRPSCRGREAARVDADPDSGFAEGFLGFRQFSSDRAGGFPQSLGDFADGESLGFVEEEDQAEFAGEAFESAADVDVLIEGGGGEKRILL